jgi:hypothetical protein
MSLSVVQVIGNVAVGGAESHMLDLVEGLLERGHEVRVVCPRPGPLSAALERRGILVNYLDMVAPRPDDDYAIDWGVLAQLTRWLDDWQPQVVHSHLYPAHVHATLAMCC